jgi:4-hydroxybenzoyl-CoA thioesterase
MATFRARRLVRFGHCDPAGIAYFPAYIDMLNGVVEDFWIALGHPWTDQLGRRHMGTPTAHLACDFVRPSHQGDVLVFSLAIERLGAASLALAHTVTRDDEVVWTCKQVLVAMDMATGKSQPWPDDIRAALQAFIAAEVPVETAR